MKQPQCPTARSSDSPQTTTSKRKPVISSYRSQTSASSSGDGGALLLDEIGELSLKLQPKLLRFLQEGEILPVGAAKSIRTDVRAIAATNSNLEEDVRAGRFRADLFARLNALRLHISPLRERREDIPPLIEHFFQQYHQEQNKRGLRLSDEALALLLAYDWPLNVRQLGNEIYRVLLAKRM